MPRAKPPDLELDDRELMKQAARAILMAEATSGKALEAKASALRRLSELTGIGVPDAGASPAEAQVADPMADLDDEVGERRRRRATGVR